MNLLALWRRPIAFDTTRAVFAEGLFMALALSFWWLAGSTLFYFLTEPSSLVPLAVVFFGTTFLGVPACIIGGFSALLLYGLLQPFSRRLTEVQAVVVGIVFGAMMVAAVLELTQWLYALCPPKAVACALYLALCGRLSGKIWEMFAKRTS